MFETEPKAIECDGINHRAKIDFITFIQHPDNVWRQYTNGTADEVKKTIAAYKADKGPNVDIFVEYCCDACKEEESND